MRSSWKDIITWQSVLALVLGVLLIGAAPTIPWPIGKALVQEIGTALLVAVFVWLFFEFSSRREQEERLDERIETISKNIFFGVFKRDLPDGLINEASMLVLEANIIRKNLVITYTLSDDTYHIGDSDVSYVRVRAVAEFELENIGLTQCTVAIGVALPNPIQPGMRDKSTVNTITIQPKGEKEHQIEGFEKAKEEMRQQMADDKNLVGRCAVSYTLQPRQALHVHTDYVMAKELEDTEVLLSLFPSDGLRVTVIDRDPRKRIVRAKAIHRAALRDSTSPDEFGTYIYTISNHMLPHQGIILWWKTRPQVQLLAVAGTPISG